MVSNFVMTGRDFLKAPHLSLVKDYSIPTVEAIPVMKSHVFYHYNIQGLTLPQGDSLYSLTLCPSLLWFCFSEFFICFFFLFSFYFFT